MLLNKHKKYYIALSLIASLFLPSISIGTPPTPITSKNISELLIYPLHNAPATSISLNDAVISAEIKGIIKNQPFQVADYVEQNVTLAEIDCKDYQLNQQQLKAEIKATQARIELTEWQLNKVKSLANKNNVSQEKVKELQTQLKTLQATRDGQKAGMQLSEIQTERCMVRAPFNGVIVERYTNIGEQAVPGTKLFRLIDTDSLEVSAQLLPNEIDSLIHAKKLYFKTQDGNYPVKMRATVQAYHANTRTQEFRGKFIDQKPLPGAIGRLVWEDSAPYLPANLLSTHNNQLGFFMLKDDKAEFVKAPKAVEGRPFPLPSQLTGEIILDGRYNLSHGETVLNRS